jgi:carbon starvation protein
MDSATRIQRYVIQELAEATSLKFMSHRQVATAFAVLSAAALALLAGQGGKGGLVLWPIFGVTNQLLASLTLVVLTTWQARRGRPIFPTLLPLVFLTATVGWAAITQMQGLLAAENIEWPQVALLGFGMLLQLWMLVEGLLCIQRSRSGEKDGRVDALGVVHS